MIGSLTGAVVT